MEPALEIWNNLREEDIVSMTFPWTIKKFSNLSKKKTYSNMFYAADYKWRILMYPKGNGVELLSVYLDVVGAAKLPLGWTRLARFSMTVVNQVDPSKSITKETVHIFDKKDSDWGFTSLIPLSLFHDSGKGYLVDDTCVIQATVLVPKAENRSAQQESVGSAPLRSSDLPHEEQTEHLTVQAAFTSEQFGSQPIDRHADSVIVKKEDFLSCLPTGEIVDFRGFGKIDKAFVPLLDEVCSWYPSLIESQRNMGQVLTEWAFMTLGRLLYFLKTRMPEDITEHARAELQKLWRELEVFNFDLSWLNEEFKRVLDTLKYVERARQLKRTSDDWDVKRKRLKDELAEAEAKYQESQRELADVKKLLEPGYRRL